MIHQPPLYVCIPVEVYKTNSITGRETKTIIDLHLPYKAYAFAEHVDDDLEPTGMTTIFCETYDGRGSFTTPLSPEQLLALLTYEIPPSIQKELDNDSRAERYSPDGEGRRV
jgi:hypothetical protein